MEHTDQPATRDEEIDVLRRCMVRMAEQLAAPTMQGPAFAAPTKRLTKMGPDDDVEAYLEVFERTADRE